MSNAYDFAVLGSGALPSLLAGFLKLRHGRSVVLVGDQPSPLRVRREIALSIMPITRPETLILLGRVGAETVAELGRMGKGLAERRALHWRAMTPDGMAALGHFRQLARMLGHAIDISSDSRGVLVRARDALALAGTPIEDALANWLGHTGVRRLSARATEIAIRRDGSAKLTHAGVTAEAAASVLADDEAIARHLYPDGLDRAIAAHPVSAFLLERPRRPLPAPYVAFVDGGVELLADGDQGLDAVVVGTGDDARRRLGAAIGSPHPVGVAGEARFTTFRTLDGAPYLGPARGGRAMVVSGFGPMGAFLAPAIARALAGASTADEAAWFALRGGSRGSSRTLASEPFGAGM